MVEPDYMKGAQKQLFTNVLQNNVLENFAKFTGKQLRWSHFFIKLYLYHKCFPMIFEKL